MLSIGANVGGWVEFNGIATQHTHRYRIIRWMARSEIPGTAGEVFGAFLWLGCTSFGGPVAHVGYFREAFVARRQWLSEADFAQQVALSQALPGPASSKLGFSLGLLRAGWGGAAAAWVGFTAPTVCLLLLFAGLAGTLGASLAGRGLLHGLQLAAVCIVAHAVWAMARALCPDWTRRAFAALAAAATLLLPFGMAQWFVVGGGALLGAAMLRRSDSPGGGAPLAAASSAVSASAGGLHTPSVRVGLAALAAFLLLLAVALLMPGDGTFAVACQFYAVGAMVFGGGHVVLPLLHDSLVARQWIDAATLTATYGAVQAMPGPLFAIAAALGAQLHASLAGPGVALAALGAIFLPGLLLQVSALGLFGALQHQRRLHPALLGVNAAVVGLLAATLWSPLGTTALRDPADLLLALACLAPLIAGRLPPLAIVAICAAFGVLRNVATG